MQQLARLYVSQFGTATAWYDHLLFNLTDSSGGHPTDVIFHLENAGGKTSLLSFVFSCFDPHRDRWLQHLQNDTHGMADYFDPDGRLAFLIMEWQLPGTRVDAPQKLILGQAVSLRAHTERGADLERCFFAFTAGQGVELEDVPAPGLGRTPGAAPARTMQEFVRWMQETARTVGDLFHTKVQDDWITHLRAARRLDMDLLRMQVEFNSNEGGMEEGFLTFHSEEELLRRFLKLTLDAEKAAAVRDGVAQTVDRQRLRPVYQNREAQLVRLQTAMRPFAESAALYEAAQAEEQRIREEAAGVLLALRQRGEIRRQEAELHHAEAERQTARARAAEQSAQEHKHLAQSIGLVRRERAVRDAGLEDTEAQRRHTEASHRLKCLRAAKSREGVRAAQNRVCTLENEQQNALQDVEPFRREAERQGARLRAGLAFEEARYRRYRAQAQEAATAAKTEMASLDKQAEKLTESTRALDREQGQVQNFVDSYHRHQETLMAEGLWKGDGLEPSLAYWRQAVEDDTARLDFLTAAREEQEELERVRRAEAAEAAQKAALAQAAQPKLREFLAEGEGLRKALAQDALLRTVTEADEADPDSPALLPALTGLEEATRTAITRCEIRHDQLDRDGKSIEETGLAGRNADVDTVVRHLQEAGVHSACPANIYVAELCPDVMEARRLVLSDPARFLGVSVAKSEWDGARHAVSQLARGLSTPVTMSVAALTPTPVTPDRLVLKPRDDAAYNKEAAVRVGDALERSLKEVDRELAGHTQRRCQAAEIRARLEGYRTRFGAERLARGEAELQRLAEEEKDARERQRACAAQADAAREQGRACGRQGEALRSGLLALGHAIQRLEEFQRNYEQSLAGKLARLEELRTQQEALQAEREALARRRVEVNSHWLKAREEAGQHEHIARALAEEGGRILYGTASAVDENEVKDSPPDALRRAYEDACRLLETNERDRLGVLAERLDNAREEWKKLWQAYQQDYGDVPEREVEPLFALDLGTAIRDQEKEDTERREEHTSATLKLVKEKTQWKVYVETLPPNFIPAPAAKAVANVDPKAAEDEAWRDKTRCVEEADQAIRAAQAARETAVNAENAARAADEQGAMLAAAIPAELSGTASALPEQAETVVSSLVQRNRLQQEKVYSCHKTAEVAFRALVGTAGSPEFRDAEPELSRDIAENPFDACCTERGRLALLIQDRLCSVRDTLVNMEPDFEKCAEELYDLTNEGIRLLLRACDIAMPDATPYVGGRHILKMRNPFSGMGKEVRMAPIRHQLGALIGEGRVPATGSELAARCLLAVSGRRELGLQVLTMEPNEKHQYQPAGELKGSRGQGAMLAMFLYLIISQLRDETRARATRGGGPLILDNPFAKVQSRPLIAAQQLLAGQIGVQLIFFTASADENILVGFPKVIRLRKAGINLKTGRSHLEQVSVELTDLTHAGGAA